MLSLLKKPLLILVLICGGVGVFAVKPLLGLLVLGLVLAGIVIQRLRQSAREAQTAKTQKEAPKLALDEKTALPSLEQDILIPFGHYDGMGSSPPPHNQIMLGREEQRSVFLDLLFNRDRRGAVLVTGGRGVGKTSFVTQCIRHYREEASLRFQRGDIGKRIPDRIITLLILLLLVGLELVVFEGAMLLSNDLRHLSPSTDLYQYFPYLKLLGAGALVVSLPFGVGLMSLLTALGGAGYLRKHTPSGSHRPAAHTYQTLGWIGWMFMRGLLFWTLATLIVIELWPKGSQSAPSSKPSTLQLGADANLALDNNPTTFWQPRNHQGPWTWEAQVTQTQPVTNPEINLEITWADCHAPDQVLVELLQVDPYQNETLVGSFSQRVVTAGVEVAREQSVGTADFVRPVKEGEILLANRGYVSTYVWKKETSFPKPDDKQKRLSSSKFNKIRVISSIELQQGPCGSAVDIAGAIPPKPRRVGIANIDLYAGRPETKLGFQLYPSNSASPLEGRPDWQLLLGLSGLLLVLYWLEYGLFVKWRPVATQIDRFHLLAQQTLQKASLPHLLHHFTHPILTVHVNLAFEDLDHRRITVAMLSGIRERFQSLFRKTNHPLPALTSLFLFMVSGGIAFTLCSLWCDLHAEDVKAEDSVHRAGGVWSWCIDVKKSPPVLKGLCSLVPEVVTRGLYFDLLAPGADLRRLGASLPAPGGKVSDKSVQQLIQIALPFVQDVGFSFRLYHLLTWALTYYLLQLALRGRGLIRHERLLERLDDALEQLSSTTRNTARNELSFASYLPFTTNERTRETERQPLDARIVEMNLLKLLEALQETNLDVPLLGTITYPAPEIIFLFDELDKVGLKAPADETQPLPGAEEQELLTLERMRAKAVHKLLGDMKNVLSSAPARFVFIGGRNLHDEWLADQTGREPLLATIFLDEVYIPSLLVEPITDLPKHLNSSVFLNTSQWGMRHVIEAYLQHHLTRAFDLMALEPGRRRLFANALRGDAPAFAQAWLTSSQAMQLWTRFPKGTALCIKEERQEPGQGSAVCPQAYYKFLAYRSLGNPKKLKELLERKMIVKAQALKRVMPSPPAGWPECNHVLVLESTDQFEVLLIADAYDQLEHLFEANTHERDDKLATAIFYLTDFMFKFHRRAFSWSNLDRVDELAHIHRAPDLRKVLEHLVMAWSEQTLHQLRNGLYDFRFRADIGREVQFISRISEHELAAFNFTLDESQSLKAQYLGQIKAMKEDVTPDILSALGELYEFDQEFEMARYYYRRALRVLDRQFRALVGSPPPADGDASPKTDIILSVLKGNTNGLDAMRRDVVWGISCLRLMLQVGMTFEITRNMERAELEYRNANTLASAIFFAMLDSEGRRSWQPDVKWQIPSDAQEWDWRLEKDKKSHRLHVLKHMNILLQPVFAEAWIKEKLPGGVDTSTAVVEEFISKLKGSLPAVRSGYKDKHLNFLLSLAEVHNKAGDLYFFKGRTLGVTETNTVPGPGFLAKAEQHYQDGLTALIDFVGARRQFHEGGGHRDGGRLHSWPDFVSRAVAGALLDIGETNAAQSDSSTHPAPPECEWENLSSKWINLKNNLEAHLCLNEDHFSLRCAAIGLMDASGYRQDACRELLLLAEELMMRALWGDSKGNELLTWASSACTLVAAEKTARSLGDSGTQSEEISTGFQYVMSQTLSKCIQYINSPGPTELNALRSHLARHPYPALGQLFGLSVLIQVNCGENPDALPLFRRLVQQYEGPFQFPPLYVARTLDKAGKNVEAAQAYAQGIQMVTMQRAFYDLTPDLYYLYDDFNDRRTHFCHTVQMRELGDSAIRLQELNSAR